MSRDIHLMVVNVLAKARLTWNHDWPVPCLKRGYDGSDARMADDAICFPHAHYHLLEGHEFYPRGIRDR
jgi:hypothetical protein